MPQMNRQYWVLASLTASTIFSLLAPFAIMGEKAGLSPAYAVFYRYILITIVALPYVLIFARHHFKFSRRHFWLLILQSVATTTLNISYMMSFTFIPLSLAVIIFFTYPIITLMVAPLVFGGRLSLVKVMVFLVAFVGLILVVGPQINNLNPMGIFLAIVAAISSVIVLLCMSKLVKEINPAALLYGVNFNATILTGFIIWALVSFGYLPSPVAFNSAMTLNFIGIVVCYILGYGIFAIVAKNLDAPTISFAANIEPIVTIALAILLFNETLSTIQAIGVIVVIGALLAGSLLKQKAA